MVLLALCCLLLLLPGCRPEAEGTTPVDMRSDARSDGFTMPAEWEPHEAVWIGWSEEMPGFHSGIAALVSRLTPHVRVRVAARSASLAQRARSVLADQGVDTTNVEFHVLSGDRYWIRDNGANYLRNAAGELAVGDFAWDNYGRPGWLNAYFGGDADSLAKYLPREVEAIHDSLEQQMAALDGLPVYRSDLVHEGGNTEVNGRGTLIVCEEAVRDRNPGITRAEATAEFRRTLGVEQVIYLPQGLADDPGGFYRRIHGDYVGGGVLHADEFVRFANDTTILLAWVEEEERDADPLSRMNFARMSANLAILGAARTVDGRPFRVVKVPLPKLIAAPIVARHPGAAGGSELDLPPDWFLPAERPAPGDSLLRVPAASYLNYLVTNGLVLLPSYLDQGTSPAREAAVAELFAGVFPDREIAFVSFMPQNWDGGGIHCSTQQQPARSPYRSDQTR